MLFVRRANQHSVHRFLYEPLTLRQISIIEREDAGQIRGDCIHGICTALQLQIPLALSNKNNSQIHLNRVAAIEPDKVVAEDFNQNRCIINDYYFINEVNMVTTLDCLKAYFYSGCFTIRPLNFRCSAIRACSLAYIKGCRSIDFLA